MNSPPEYKLGLFNYAVGPRLLLDQTVIIPVCSLAAMMIPPSLPPLDFVSQSPHPSVTTSFYSSSAASSSAGSPTIASPVASRSSSPVTKAAPTKAKKVRKRKPRPHLVVVLGISLDSEEVHARLAYIVSFSGPTDPDLNAPIPTTNLRRRDLLFPLEAAGRVSPQDLDQNLKPLLFPSHTYFSAPRLAVEDWQGVKYVNDRMSWVIAKEEVVKVTEKNPLRLYIPNPSEQPNLGGPGAHELVNSLRLTPLSIGNLLSDLPRLDPSAAHNLVASLPPAPSSLIPRPGSSGGGREPEGPASSIGGAGGMTRSGGLEGVRESSQQQLEDESEEEEEESMGEAEPQSWEQAVEEEERLYWMFSGRGDSGDGGHGGYSGSISSWRKGVALDLAG